MIIPRPDNSPWDLWASTVVGYNPGLEQALHPGLPWRTFASFLTQQLPGTPNHAGFDDWRKWADALKLAVQT